MGRWDEDDFYIGRIIALFPELTTQEKNLLCDVAQSMIEGRKVKENEERKES